jgi:hypothetical protein
MLYLFLFLFLFLPTETTAQVPDSSIDYSIEVQASRNFEIFIAEPNIKNTSENIKAEIAEDIVFGYASSHYYMMKVDNGTGGHEPIGLNYKGKVKVYNSDTIKYVWENCNYIIDPIGCSYKNNHFSMVTNVTITDEQITIAMYLYDSEMQILSQGIVTKTHSQKLIPQQKTITNSRQSQNLPLSVTTQPQCNSSSGQCPPQLGMTIPSPPTTNQSIITEDLNPIVVEIPPRLLTSQFHQASLRLWSGVKYNFD